MFRFVLDKNGLALTVPRGGCADRASDRPEASPGAPTVRRETWGCASAPPTRVARSPLGAPTAATMTGRIVHED